MATENSEASCDADPNFAVICGFFERFGTMCGLNTIDFLYLKEMLENTQEVPKELIDLHIKLLRKARKSVSSERWERALIKLCHTSYCNKDGWELERFGYKKASIGSKLRILKQLLEMQFDYNQKFKNDINKMSAAELRSQPIGRDSSGRIYWYQCDESCQIRVYKEDPDEETWSLIAKNRDGLVNVITQLNNGDSAKSSSEPVSNEDSNSVEVEKPTLDTGQKSENLKIDESDNAQNQTLSTVNIEKEGENNELNEDENDQDLSEIDENSVENSLENENLDEESSQSSQNNEGLDLSIKSKPVVLDQPKKEFVGIKGKYIREESASVSVGKAVRSASKDALSYKRPLEDDEIEEPKCIKQRRMNRPTLLIKKTQQESQVAEESEEDEDIDEEEDEDVEDEEDEVDEEEDEDEEEEVGEEIEEPTMLIRGQGNGHSNKSCPIIVSEEIEDTFYFYGAGNGYDCQTGNESTEKDDDKTKIDVKNENINDKDTQKKCPEQSTSSFFFGSKSFTAGASLSFGTSLNVSSSNVNEQSSNIDETENVETDLKSTQVPEILDKLDNKIVNKEEHSTSEIQNEEVDNEKIAIENGTKNDDLEKNDVEEKTNLDLATEIIKKNKNDEKNIKNQIVPELEAEEDEIESLEHETKMISLGDDSTDGKIEQLERDARNISLDDSNLCKQKPNREECMKGNEEIDMIEVNSLEENEKKLNQGSDAKSEHETVEESKNQSERIEGNNGDDEKATQVEEGKLRERDESDDKKTDIEGRNGDDEEKATQVEEENLEDGKLRERRASDEEIEGECGGGEENATEENIKNVDNKGTEIEKNKEKETVIEKNEKKETEIGEIGIKEITKEKGSEIEGEIGIGEETKEKGTGIQQSEETETEVQKKEEEGTKIEETEEKGSEIEERGTQIDRKTNDKGTEIVKTEEKGTKIEGKTKEKRTQIGGKTKERRTKIVKSEERGTKIEETEEKGTEIGEEIDAKLIKEIAGKRTEIEINKNDEKNVNDNKKLHEISDQIKHIEEKSIEINENFDIDEKDAETSLIDHSSSSNIEDNRKENEDCLKNQSIDGEDGKDGKELEEDPQKNVNKHEIVEDSSSSLTYFTCKESQSDDLKIDGEVDLETVLNLSENRKKEIVKGKRDDSSKNNKNVEVVKKIDENVQEKEIDLSISKETISVNEEKKRKKIKSQQKNKVVKENDEKKIEEKSCGENEDFNKSKIHLTKELKNADKEIVSKQSEMEKLVEFPTNHDENPKIFIENQGIESNLIDLSMKTKDSCQKLDEEKKIESETEKSTLTEPEINSEPISGKQNVRLEIINVKNDDDKNPKLEINDVLLVVERKKNEDFMKENAEDEKKTSNLNEKTDLKCQNENRNLRKTGGRKAMKNKEICREIEKSKDVGKSLELEEKMIENVEKDVLEVGENVKKCQSEKENVGKSVVDEKELVLKENKESKKLENVLECSEIEESKKIKNTKIGKSSKTVLVSKKNKKKLNLKKNLKENEIIEITDDLDKNKELLLNENDKKLNSGEGDEEKNEEIPKKRAKTTKKITQKQTEKEETPIVINLDDKDDFPDSDGDEPELITNSPDRDSSSDREENNDLEISNDKIKKINENVDKKQKEDEVGKKRGGNKKVVKVVKSARVVAPIEVKEKVGGGEKKKKMNTKTEDVVDGNINGESSTQDTVQVRRSTRKKPGDSLVAPELPKMKRRGKSHPSYSTKHPQEPPKLTKQPTGEESAIEIKPKRSKQTENSSKQPKKLPTGEESPVETKPKRSKLTENSSSPSPNIENDNKDDEEEEEKKEKPKINGPFLSCVSIQKLQEPQLKTPSPPVSIKSDGDDNIDEIPSLVAETVDEGEKSEAENLDDLNKDNKSDDVILIEDDGQNESDDCVEVTPTAKSMTLSTFQLDVEDSPPRLSPKVVRKKRTRQDVEKGDGNNDDDDEEVMSSKKRKLKGKRQVDKDLRRSIEEQKKRETISSEEDEDNEENGENEENEKEENEEKEEKQKEKSVTTKKKPPINKGGYKRKKTLLGLDIPDIIDFTDTSSGNVRQSRRIAQLKIREEAERRKIEELTSVEVEKKRKSSKKDEDKDYKFEKVKVKKSKVITQEDDPVVVIQSDEEVEMTKKKKKKRKKHVDPRKIFDESNPWRSSSDSSSNEEVAEEEEEEISDPGSPLFKSDHEFSPESDIEGGEEVQPLKRARTARKEDDCEEVDDCSCQKCGKKDHPEWILLCDGCENGWHCSCLRPALLVIPEGDWFCPPCQHLMLVKNLERKLIDFDKKLAKRQIVVRRRERLAYVGISLANVLPVKKSIQNKEVPPVVKRCARKKPERRYSSESESSNNDDEESGSESSESDSDDEPIYQLRQRRQAHSYRFNDYDELINSAIRDEMDAVKGAGNQGKGKDISTIVNANEDEQITDSTKPVDSTIPEENKVQNKPIDLHSEKPESVPEITGSDQKQQEQESEEEEEPIKPIKKFIGRKKPRKLNSLDVSSEDDADSDEDFKGSSSDEEEDDYEDDLGSDSSDYGGGGRRKGPIRRSTRARRSRYDREFINDDSDDEEEEEEKKRKKGGHRPWTETESEESDQSWGRRKRSKRNNVSSSSPKKRKPKKSKKRFDDSEEEERHINKKKRKIKYGGLNDDDDDETEEIGRRTRGKKINYAAVLASDSDDDEPKKPSEKLESDDDFVAEDADQDDDDDEAIDQDEIKKMQDVKNNASNLEQPKILIQSNVVVPQQKLLEKVSDSNDTGTNQDEEEDDINPIEAMNRNLEEMDEEEMEKLMEEEEYANKQLQLMALQLEKEKKRKEREAQKKVQEDEADNEEKPPPKTPQKRGRKPKNPNLIDGNIKNPIDPILSSNQPNPDININQLNNPLPGNPLSEGDSPKKRRGRGKGKKTLEKEAAAAAAAAAAATTTTPGPPQVTITTAIVAGGNENTTPELQSAKLTVAAPPQPFAQTQPVPSVITRMLQGGRPPGNYGQMDGFYGEQPVAGEAGPPPGNAAMPPGALPPPIVPPYIQAPGSVPSAQYRPPPAPLLTPFHRSSPVPTQPQLRLRHPAPPPPPPPGGIYQHHSLDPSPSGAGTVGIPPTGNTPEERVSPDTVPPDSESASKTVEPHPRQQPPQQPPPAPQMSPRFGTPPVVPPPPHIRMPYQPSSVQHPTSYFYMSQNMGGEENMNYPYGEQFSETNSPQEAAKGYEEENSGEFGGLVSYFSSQREDDLDT